jgi:type VII secretion-associated serine protease mycosin
MGLSIALLFSLSGGQFAEEKPKIFSQENFSVLPPKNIEDSRINIEGNFQNRQDIPEEDGTQPQNEVVVSLSPEVKGKDIAAQIGAELLREGPLNYVTLRLTPEEDFEQQLKKLKNLPGVKRVSQREKIRLSNSVISDPGYQDQWGLSQVKADKAWDLGATGEGIIIAVVDTGVDINHPDLKDNLVSGYNGILRSESPYALKDNNGHGTHVAGIAAARMNGIGVVGIAPQAKIMPIKAMNQTGEGYDDVIADGVAWAADHGAKIINLSLGSSDITPILQDALAYATGEGSLIVAAAGNYDPTTQKNPGVSFPAADPNVLAVTASTESNSIASFSSTGNEVELAAPGEKIVSTWWDRTRGSGYVESSGSSMAAPFVSGEAALIWSKHPDWTREQVLEVLRESAQDLGTAGRDSSYGYGLIDAEMAIKLAEPLQIFNSPALIDSLGGIVKGEQGSTQVSLEVPEKALTSAVTVKLTSQSFPQELPEGIGILSEPIQVDWSGASLKRILTLKIKDPQLENKDSAVLYHWSGSRWLSVGGEYANGQLTLTTFTPGLYVAGTDLTQPDKRIAGWDAVETSLKISQTGFPLGSDTVILARNDLFPDALAGAPLAHKFQAPILLTPSAGLTEEVRQELTRLSPKTVYLLGGQVALSPTIQNELAKNYSVKRLAGESAYGTAQAIAKELGSGGEAVLASGKSFPDALVIASWAAREGLPILLTDAWELPQETQTGLRELNITHTLVIGGEAVIRPSVEEDLPSPKRLWGWTQYDTLAEVLKAYPPQSKVITVATGENFPDALTGAVLAAQRGSMMVLTPVKSSMPESLRGVLEEWSNKQVEALGGTVALPDGVVDSLQNLVQ